ncbi:Beta-galactosidase C-terminal domain [Streptomyces sp. 5-10]|uniref:Beta-galactosidase C-terminal domain n=1 Tax=Streptomyces sp. 5-10 TaxID=878925 RepID=UPI00351A3642
MVRLPPPRTRRAGRAARPRRRGGGAGPRAARPPRGRRGGAARPYLFLLNHGRTPAVVPLPSARTDLLTGRAHHTSVRLDRFAVMVPAPPESPG